MPSLNVSYDRNTQQIPIK